MEHTIAHLAHGGLRSMAQDRCDSRSSAPAPASRQCPPHIVLPTAVLRASHQRGRCVCSGFLSFFCAGKRLRQSPTGREGIS